MHHRFKKKLLEKLFLSSCALMLATTGGSAMDEETIRMGRESHDKQSLAPGNLKAVETFRAFYRDHSEGSHNDTSLAEHQDVLIPFAQFLLETMSQEKQNSDLEELQKEVEIIIAKKRVSPDWLIDMHFRFLALGGMSESERDIFSHVPHHKYLDALLAKDIYNKPVVVDLNKWGASLNREGEYFYTSKRKMPFLYGQGVSKKAMSLINKVTVEHLHPPIIYPSLGEGILPIRLIIRNWLDEIYHLGMPIKNVKDVHGEENTSKLGFAFHDLFHYKNDKRRASLGAYLEGMVGSYVQSGQGFVSDIIPQLVPLAVQKYKLIGQALEKAYLSLETDNHALMGFFILAHEVSPFSPELFDLSNPIALMNAMVSKGLSYYSNPNAWENPDDPLQTLLNGGTVLDDEMIKELALARLAEDGLLNLPYQIYEKRGESGGYLGYAKEERERIEIRKAWLPKNTRSVVKKTAQFIDVIVEFADGQKKTITYPTLNRKWKNVNASLGSLFFAGIKLEPPVLAGLDPNQDRANALEFIELVRSKLENTMTDFAQKAKDTFGEGPGSYTEEYTAKFKAIGQKIEELVGIVSVAGRIS